MGCAQIASGVFGFDAEESVGFDVNGGKEEIEVVVRCDDVPPLGAVNGSPEDVFNFGSLKGADDPEQEGVIVFGQQEATVMAWKWNALVGLVHAIVCWSRRLAEARGVRS